MLVREIVLPYRSVDAQVSTGHCAIRVVAAAVVVVYIVADVVRHRAMRSLQKTCVPAATLFRAD